MFATYGRTIGIIVICALCAFAWAGNAQKPSPAKTTPTAAGKQQSPGTAQPVSLEAPELDEGLIERLEKNEDPEDVKSILAFHRFLKKRMYLAEKKAPAKEITDVNVEILKTILAVNPKRRDVVFDTLEETWDGKDDYFKVFISIFTQLESYRKHFRLRFGQLKAWEIYLKGQHRKVLGQREKKQEAARLKAAAGIKKKAATPTPTPTA